ncbi:MAG TPA: ABC transporter permease [Anaeromyxobacter sp.]|nr:ABC transporter permease [Anaeromyxobacter sp.]
MSEPSSTASSPSATASRPGPAPAAPLPGAGHPAPPVFHWGALLLVTTGLLGAVALVPVAHAFFTDRLALAGPLATGLTALAASALAVGVGALAGYLERRLAFYEIFTASLAWVAIAAVLVMGGQTGRLPVLAGLASQGALVMSLALLGLGGLAATAVFMGSSLAFLVAGAGRLDPSFSYELYVALSHLRLTKRTLAGALGLLLLSAILPLVGLLLGALVMVVWQLVRDAAERRAYRRGELVSFPRMPATKLMTLISTAAVAIGVWALIVVLSVMSGFSADLKGKILGHTAHGMVLTYGQDDFGDWREVRKKTLEVRGVVGATPFLYNEVMLATGQNMTGAILKGIDVATVGTVTDLPASIQSGELSWLTGPGLIPSARAGDTAHPLAGRPMPGIVLGKELAHSLRVQVGDPVSVVSPFGDLGPSGPQPKSRPFRVAGLFYSGMYEYDSKFAYIDLDEAERFFGSDTVTGLEVKVAEVDAARAVMDRVVFALGGWPYRAKDWSELNRSLFAALQQEKVVMAVILGFIVLVATFTILATLIMMVLEKRREIAVLKSMGAGVASIMRIFVLEGVAIGLVGALFGLVLGLSTCLVIDRFRIPLPPDIYYIDRLPVVMDGAQFMLVALAALVLSYLATLYPAAKAARLHPVDGLRSE